MPVRFLCPYCLGVCIVNGFNPGQRGTFVCENLSGRLYTYCDASNSCEGCDRRDKCGEGVVVRVTIEDCGCLESSKWCRPHFRGGQSEA